MSNKNADYYFLKGGGEMGELIRSKDWSKTSLGDPAVWPKSLCTMVAVMLDNPFAMYIAWGSDYIQLYNDGYRPILGSTKHPQALGISTRETFSEIWHIIESMFDGVMKGKAVGFSDFMLPLNRNGYEEECFFDFSYSPIRKDNGEVGGVLVTVIETTNKKIAEELLKESEHRFRDTVKQAPVGITILRGKEYMVEMANDAYMQLVDREATEFIGKPLFDSLPEVEEFVRELLDGVMDTGIPFHGNEVPVTLNRYGQQEVFYFDFLYHPLKDGDGKISGIIVTVTEVSEKVSARKKIEESEKKFEAAILAVEGIIWTNNAVGEMIGEQPGWVKLTGQRFEEYQGYGWTKAVHPDDVQPTVKAWNNAVENKSTFEFEHRLKTKQDGWRLFSIKAVPAMDQNGVIKQWVGVHTDITDQREAVKKIQESEERFRSLAQTLPQLVWVTDAQGNAEFTSKCWKEYSGIEPGGEKEWKAIVHPDDYDGINAAWVHSLTTGTIYRHDVRLKSKTDEYRWHTVVGEPTFDKENKIVKWVGAFTDIHEQKIKEEKKDEFISIASHELKTPLTTAKAYLQMLELTLDITNAEANLYAQKANQSVRRLEELISELLDVSKIRLGKLNYTITTFNFNDLVNSTVDNIQLTSPIHFIIKAGKVNDEVTGDKERLQQVIINLLNNAIKYSPNANKVFINIEQQDNIIKVSVQDSGIGIAQHSLNKIFDKYHRIEEHAVHFQGLGIGLFISYEIIQRHHGKLWADSEPGRGSTFYFTIPVKHIVQAD